MVIAPTRAACETIELAMGLQIETLLEREHGHEIRQYAQGRTGFGIVAGTGTGKTLAIRLIAEEVLQAPLRVGVVNREREATPDTPNWNVVIVTTGIARRWFQSEIISSDDTLVADEIHQTSAELELCLALGKRIGCRFVWLSATVDPDFYANYLNSTHVLETTAYDPALAASVTTRRLKPLQFLDGQFLRHVVRDRRGVAVFVPTRAEVEEIAAVVGERRPNLDVVFYHGGEPIRVIRPFLEGDTPKPFLIAMTAAGQSALNIRGLDTVVIYDARYTNLVDRGRNVLTRLYLGANEILQMAGRVHGRVEQGEVIILTDRDLDFDSLTPTPPEFQLAGDSERVALTAAAIGIDLTELDLPVPLDRIAYRRAVKRLTTRGIIEGGRLTGYGRDVEAMPVDRAWGELLVRVQNTLTPVVAVVANIESLHRMTRDESDLRGLIVRGSDHLTSYNIYCEAVNKHGYVGNVFGLPRHLFDEELAEWAERRGVLVKAIEDAALGTASIYRTLDLELPERLSPATDSTARSFRSLLAEVMPLDLVVDERTATDEPVRVGRGSMCRAGGAVAGTIRYFADRRGITRGGIEGTNLSLTLIRRFATRAEPTVEVTLDRKGKRNVLHVVHRTEYFDFVLDNVRERLVGEFPVKIVNAARDALTDALVAGVTQHPAQQKIRRALNQLGEYWRRSGGDLPAADPVQTRQSIRETLSEVKSWEEFLETRVELDDDALVSAADRARLDALPSSAHVRGDRVPLDYEIENGQPVVRLRVRLGQARRLRTADLPDVDRPLRFTVLRGQHRAIRADSLEELREAVISVPSSGGRRRKQRYPRRRRR